MPERWQAEAPWREATPRDHERKGPWWTMFDDPVLDALQRQALEGNQTLAGARARLDQARALARVAGASWFPRLDLVARSGRQGPSENRPTYNANLGAAAPQNDHAVQLGLSYELDLFGRIDSEVAASVASAQQAEADLENVRLLVGTDLAAFYFNLRSIDAEIDVVRQGLVAQERAIDLLEARRSGGAASGLDLAQQQALYDATRTQLELLRRQRLLFEHALATLVGVPASRFTVAALAPGAAPLPVAPLLPPGVPSDLLERRPDIAAAERAVAAANAQVGVTRAAAFPSILLGASVGQQSRSLSSLFDAGSLLWSVGSSLAVSVFDAGRNDARLQASRAAHEASVAAYRQTVLRALQEVEDGLGGLQVLAQAADRAGAAVASSQRVLDIATARYDGGVTTYLDVVTAQQVVLNNRRLATQLRGQQLAATALLAKALGGGFEPSRAEGIGKVAAAENAR
jgi:NodT family efflux transporter outer membrane factor (OMF) lipoprotein